MFKRLAMAAPALLLLTAPGFAHPGPADNGSFLAGFSHPLFGLDHILVMVAVGVWAVIVGGRAIVAVPAAFVGTMVVGYLFSLTGLGLPYVEPMILSSLVALGLLIAAAIRLPAAAGAFLVALFALFHGYAHGTELGLASALSFGLGFAIATAMLHAVGIGIGLPLGSGVGIAEAWGKTVIRVLGATTALTGIALAFGG
jgi:urease accessory protein